MLSPSNPPSERRNLAQLVARLEAAQKLMSRHNPNRALMHECAAALVDLAYQLHQQPQPTMGQRFGLNVSDFPEQNPLQAKP